MKIVIKKSSKFFIYGLASILFLNGCGLDRLLLDESNLEKVANYYYRPGGKTNLSNDGEYHFLSSKSKAQLSLDEWIKICGKDRSNYTKSITVLGVKEQAGQMYAIVSVSYEGPGKDGKKGKYVFSRTWTLENGKWRLLAFPKTKEKVEKSGHDGDYANAKTEAEEWLSMDPFSVDAYNRLGFALERIGKSTAGRSKDDILRAELAINPEATAVLFDAVRMSESPSIAKYYLKKLEGTGEYSEAAFNYVLAINDKKSQLKFLESIEITPGLGILKLEAIAELVEKENTQVWDEFRKVAATEGTFEKIKAELDGEDSYFASTWAGKLGLSFYASNDNTTAQKYLDYGISRDPNNEDIKVLSNMLHPQ